MAFNDMKQRMKKRALILTNRVLVSTLLQLLIAYQVKSNSLRKYSDEREEWVGTVSVENTTLKQCQVILERRMLQLKQLNQKRDFE